MKFSKHVVDMALTQLAYYYQSYAVWSDYASTEDNPVRRGKYARRALRNKTKGLVGHDRILTNPVYY